ncbi:MAG: DUF4339 domain-containing protein, partial [Rhodospirillales bacterium]|nr:DUF4339 domain-containing protein [Rhodospirillales bacterium]
MAGEWYCKLAGVTTGPLAPRELKALAVGGKLGPNDLVRHGDQGPWVPAVCVKGLLSPDSAGAAEPEAYVQPEAETVKRGPAKYSKPASRQVKSLPVAQPVEDPPPAPASKAAKASSKPAPVAVLRAGPVVVGTPADSVTSRALGRAPVDPRKRKRNNLLAIGALVLAAVGLCVGGAFLLMKNRAGTEPVAAKSPGGSKADAAKTKSAGEGAEKPAPAESPEAAPSEADWVDASKRAVRRDDVRVQVLSARIGPAPAAAVDKPGTYLLITVQVQNSGEEK